MKARNVLNKLLALTDEELDRFEVLVRAMHVDLAADTETLVEELATHIEVDANTIIIAATDMPTGTEG